MQGGLSPNKAAFQEQEHGSQANMVVCHLETATHTCPDQPCSFSAGAAAAGVLKEQMFIPCQNSLDCTSYTLPQSGLSVIAGHFSWQELQHAGIHEFDCLVSMRNPVDRAASCLLFFYGDLMADVGQMSAEEFRYIVTEKSLCNNVAAAMLLSDVPGISARTVNRAALNASLGAEITVAAVRNLERCVVIDLANVMRGQVGSLWAPAFIGHWFPWLKDHVHPGIPHRNDNPRAFRLPHRHIKILEELNSVDTAVFDRAVELMQQQQRQLQGHMGIHRQNEASFDTTLPAKEEPTRLTYPGTPWDLRNRQNANTEILRKHDADWVAEKAAEGQSRQHR